MTAVALIVAVLFLMAVCGWAAWASRARTYLWLDDILPGIEVDYDRYAACERHVITPALIKAGYSVLGDWHTGDGDSFGPLTRCVKTDRGTVVYG